MKRFFSTLILTCFFLSVAAAAVPFKVDGLRSNGNVEINGSASIGTSSAPDSKAVLDLVSTTKGFLTPRMTTVQRDAISSPTTGLLIYNTDTNTLNQYNGTAWGVVAGSGGGGRNYIEENPDAETNTTGWVTYADAAGSIPVDGTGGSANITWTRTTSTPLAGDGSFLLTKDAVNRQGQGVSFDFTIEREDRGKMLQIDYTYEIASGTYATGDLSWHIYDVTNSRYIQPSAYQVENVGVSSYAQPLTFQTSIDSTSYRLILHVASTSAVAYTAKFDSVKVGPQNQANGPPVTDWVSYTPTGSWTSNSTYSGKYRIIGDTMHYKVRVAIAGGSPNATSLTINHMPAGFSIDTSKLLGTNGAEVVVATCGVTANGNAYSATAYHNGTNIAPVTNVTSSSYSLITNISNTIPATFVSGDEVECEGSTPLAGRSSNVVVSSSANTRPVAAWRNTLSSTTITANTALQFTTAGYDSHGGFTSNSTYTVPVPGYYRVVFNGLSLSSGTANCNLVVNGTGRSILAGYGSSIRGIGVASAQVNAGDAITVSCDSSVTASSAAAVNLFIEKMDGPAQITAGNLILARYTTAAGQSTNGTGSATLIDFGTKDFDLTGSVTTGASWKFTAPAPGYYELCAQILLSATTGWADTEALEVTIYKNGSAQQRISYRESFGSGSQLASGNGCGIVQLNATEYADIRVTQLNGSSINLFGNAQYNWVTVKRIGGVH